MNNWPIFSQPHAKALLSDILKQVGQERLNFDVLPSDAHLFNAFKLCSYDSLKVVILGQDPYHTPGCAHGLAFSILSGVKHPPSLKNIFKELFDDVGVTRFSGDLSDWASQGVLLLNTTLTVRAHHAHSHQHLGWEEWVKEVIKDCNGVSNPVCFVLWGNHAQRFESLITNPKHMIIKSAHPSPLSAYQGFFGSKPFSKINTFLQTHSLTTIHWSDNP
jgi:uracil-DNA glycosylase